LFNWDIITLRKEENEIENIYLPKFHQEDISDIYYDLGKGLYLNSVSMGFSVLVILYTMCCSYKVITSVLKKEKLGKQKFQSSFIRRHIVNVFLLLSLYSFQYILYLYDTLTHTIPRDFVYDKADEYDIKIYRWINILVGFAIVFIRISEPLVFKKISESLCCCFWK